MRRAHVVTVAVYERLIRASPERIWENVLDWEHLPSLHRESFSSVRRIDSGDWGFTAEVKVPGSERAMTLRVALEREQLRYVTATIEGPGAGTEIWTHLEPKSEHETQIRVEFRVPDVSPERVATLGNGYRALYAKLWDEDEAMMRRRQALLDAQRRPEPRSREVLELGALEDVRAKLPLDLVLDGRPFRVVDVDGGLVAHSTVCPHWLGPLELAKREGSVIACPWHDYRFDLRTGRSCDGRGLRLAPAPSVRIENGQVSLGWSGGA
jgi:nitrite reductase/ring-hydroxylating ferredoxin subunit